jgi:hypothetical protein
LRAIPVGREEDLRRFFLPRASLPDSLTGGGNIALMHHRLIALLALFCFAFSAGGCELFESSKKPKSSKKKKRYKEVMMPMQTGSNLQRRAYVETWDDEVEPAKKPKKKPSPSPKPDAEPSATPVPTEEESPAPTPERFR